MIVNIVRMSTMQRFAAVIMRIRDPRTTALIFSSGKMVCTGAKRCVCVCVCVCVAKTSLAWLQGSMLESFKSLDFL